MKLYVFFVLLVASFSTLLAGYGPIYQLKIALDNDIYYIEYFSETGGRKENDQFLFDVYADGKWNYLPFDQAKEYIFNPQRSYTIYTNHVVKKINLVDEDFCSKVCQIKLSSLQDETDKKIDDVFIEKVVLLEIVGTRSIYGSYSQSLFTDDTDWAEKLILEKVGSVGYDICEYRFYTVGSWFVKSELDEILQNFLGVVESGDMNMLELEYVKLYKKGIVISDFCSC